MKVSELELAQAQVASLQAAAAEASKASEACIAKTRAETAGQVCVCLSTPRGYGKRFVNAMHCIHSTAHTATYLSNELPMWAVHASLHLQPAY
jgi:hypothetical protein